MKQDTVIYYANGNVDDLSEKLREKGFGVPYCWEDIMNEPTSTRRISPNLETMRPKIKDDGTIVDSIIIGDLQVERIGEEKTRTEFKLEIYLNHPRGEELRKFADRYEPSVKIN